MRRPGAHGKDSERGQATVEFLGTLPAALLVVLIAWQLVLAGETSWLAGNAARVAARAHAVGGDPTAAARSALPSHLRRRLEVTRDGDRARDRGCRGHGAPEAVSESRSGQASVELVAGAAVVLLTALIGFQLLAVGYGAVMADHAAEAAALALANGREPEAAARAAVPGWPERGMRITGRGGRVSVELVPPSPFGFLRGRLALRSEAAVRLPATARPVPSGLGAPARSGSGAG
jgi:hypothetical protein